jgi:hypothetical protein
MISGVSLEIGMQRFLQLATTLLVVGAAAICAQAQELPPLYRGPITQVRGVFVTPIAGTPFSAVVVIESKRTLPDGTVETRHSQALVARDSRGRIRNEMHALVPDEFPGVPPLISAHIFDPETRISYFLNPATMIARLQIVPPPRQISDALNSGGQDLGYTTLNGMQAKGTRITRTIPAQVSGTGKEVEITDEFWYSEDLHMNLLERHTDIRGGQQTVALLSIKTVEPDPSLFEVPAGYKVVDLTPAENSPVARQNAIHSARP